ncbi:hypothetical protein PRIPAC_95452 [Pristionchus pacificus]|uniref:G protein-coupled receptor n=1 Tax=Pristionchus pacificus TaxID=54126 RepID=A0A2A6B2X0_PRIPA|nr:hypothetical protein PRIPAC_95452 [Pristionchus pacificus]|eukprot:PDM60225.1 G protein-coupled receptor [Pristionchus pacificus]
MHIRDVIHIFYAIVGIPVNFVLLYVIIQMRSSSQLKSYALILFNIAISDIIEIALEVFGGLSIYDPHSIPSVIWSPTVPIITYTAVIVIRGKIVNRLASLAENMSQQTNIVHQSLIRALSVHAMLPLTICIGISSFYLQLLGVRGEFIDSMLFTFAWIPSVFNPMLTLFFMMPYRRFILTAFGRVPKTSIQFVPVVRRSSVNA